MEHIEAMSLQDQIVAQLRRAILDGSIVGGTELAQVALAAKLGVSRMPVREALFALEHQGLVVRLPNNHCRVVAPTATQVSRVLALCECVEASVLLGLGEQDLAQVPARELAFHAALRDLSGEGYPRRVLATTSEVYVAYLAERAAAMRGRREGLLERALGCAAAADEAGVRAGLGAYFSMLMEDCPFGEGDE